MSTGVKTSMLRVNDLKISVTNRNKKQHILVNNVSFDVAAGEVLSIIGPNGAGKSSILRAIDGDLEYSGSIYSEALERDPRQRAKRFAVLPQQSSLNFPFNVSEVVELGRTPHESGKRRDREIIDSALELMDISYLKNRDYMLLSGGEKQRVQLARVFSQIWDGDTNKPRLLLLDEPSSSLDLGHQHHLMKAIRKFAEQGVTIVVVMHDINLAARYADKMLALLCSEQVAYGSPKQVVTENIMRRLYGLNVEVLSSSKHGHPVLIGA